jgi:hypothetical protein
MESAFPQDVRNALASWEKSPFETGEHPRGGNPILLTPSSPSDASIRCLPRLYKKREEIERLFRRSKGFRSIFPDSKSSMWSFLLFFIPH